MSTFTTFDLNEKILKALSEIGYEKPTPIQEQAIPKIIEGSDLIAAARTGTGKTAAFMLPILHLIANNPVPKIRAPQVLILVPTRELAMQVAVEAKKFSKYLPQVKTVCIYGGVPYPIQKKALSVPYDILVATPGRLMDHMDQGRIDLSKIKLLVLDEADRMLDMGFVDAVEQIAAASPKNRQTLLFSATIDRKILPISKKLQNNPIEIKVAESDPASKSNIEQFLYYVDNISHKLVVLDHLLKNTEINQAIIFTSTINQTTELSDYLNDKGYESAFLNGDMNQPQRTRTIEKLRRGKIQFLVATDVAARGIDIASLSHVFNFDLPFQPEDFVHRIGRTGRAGASGVAITFATYKEDRMVSRINQLIGKPLESHIIAGMEPKPKQKEKDSNGGSRRPSRRSRFKGSSSRGPNPNKSSGHFSKPGSGSPPKTGFFNRGRSAKSGSSQFSPSNGGNNRRTTK